jgi:membrane protein implicated in regulation of membrane protease activity
VPVWLAWGLVAVALGVGEILTPGLFFLGPVALAALAAALTAAFGAPLWTDIVVFGLGSFASLGFLRPLVRSHLRVPHELRTGTAALQGAKAVVLQRVDDLGGRVKIGGEEWTARSYMPDEVFEPGTKVEVMEIDGATALVYK